MKTPSASSRDHGQTWRQRAIPSLLAAQGLLCVRLTSLTNGSLWRDRRVDLSPIFHGDELLERGLCWLFHSIRADGGRLKGHGRAASRLRWESTCLRCLGE